MIEHAEFSAPIEMDGLSHSLQMLINKNDKNDKNSLPSFFRAVDAQSAQLKCITVI